jgi:hypothetical protein
MITLTKASILSVAMLLPSSLESLGEELPVLGQGNLSCTSWIERRAGDALDAATMTAWVLGYVTAYNEYAGKSRADVSGGRQSDELGRWLDDYCKKNPRSSFYSASAALIRSFPKSTSP